MVSRREARETVFCLLFETDFHTDAQVQDILALAKEDREIADDPYIEATYYGVSQKCAALDVLISRFSKGWKTTRLSHVSRAVMRLCTYELLYSDVPATIALNEAIELAKKFDDPKARPFVNGVLNSIKSEVEAKGAAVLAKICEDAAADAMTVPVESEESEVQAEETDTEE